MFVVNGCLTDHEPCHPNCRGWDPFNLPELADRLGSARDHSEIMRCDDCCADMGADYNDGHAVVDAARWAREVIRNERVGADLGAVLACLAVVPALLRSRGTKADFRNRACPAPAGFESRTRDEDDLFLPVRTPHVRGKSLITDYRLLTTENYMSIPSANFVDSYLTH